MPVTAPPHPLGIQPEGNAWLEGIHSARLAPTRKLGLGGFNALPDPLLLQLLEWLDGPSLSTFSCCSRAAYAFGSHADLWRTLVLSSRGQGGDGDGESSSPKEEAGLDFHPAGWKATFVKAVKGAKAAEIFRPPIDDDEGEDDKASSHRPHARGLYSDLLHKSWLCSVASPDPKWLAVNDCDRRSADSLTVEAFRRDFEQANKPVVITDCINKWPAYGKWSPEHLTKVCDGHPDARFDAGGFNLTMGEYCRYAASVEGRDEFPLYLFCKHLFNRIPELASDFSVPEYFQGDLFGLLGEKERPDYRWLIVGPKRSGSVFHVDPNATNAWNACITGSKLWVMFPPDSPPPGVQVSADGSEVATSMSPIEWCIDFYAAARAEARRLCREAELASKAGATAVGQKRKRADAASSAATASGSAGRVQDMRWSAMAATARRISANAASAVPPNAFSLSSSSSSCASGSDSPCVAAPAMDADRCERATALMRASSPGLRPVEAVVKAGEVIFVPRGWYHLVLNLEDSIAVTSNYCSEANLPHVLHFLKEMPYAVSGIPEEKKESLYGRFREALEKACPDVLQRAEERLAKLSEALEGSKAEEDGEGGSGDREGKRAKTEGDAAHGEPEQIAPAAVQRSEVNVRWNALMASSASSSSSSSSGSSAASMPVEGAAAGSSSSSFSFGFSFGS